MAKIYVSDRGVLEDHGYNLVCSGYLVEEDRVLLVHHNGFDKWVPPGGHIVAGETFAQTAVREFKEETGLTVTAVSAQPEIHEPDANATPEPVPFYVDLEREGFAVPTLVQFFYVRRTAFTDEIVPQLAEVHQVAWFAAAELEQLPTFDQVRSLATYALAHHPDARPR